MARQAHRSQLPPLGVTATPSLLDPAFVLTVPGGASARLGVIVRPPCTVHFFHERTKPASTRPSHVLICAPAEFLFFREAVGWESEKPHRV